MAKFGTNEKRNGNIPAKCQVNLFSYFHSLSFVILREHCWLCRKTLPSILFIHFHVFHIVYLHFVFSSTIHIDVVRTTYNMESSIYSNGCAYIFFIILKLAVTTIYFHVWSVPFTWKKKCEIWPLDVFCRHIETGNGAHASTKDARIQKVLFADFNDFMKISPKYVLILLDAARTYIKTLVIIHIRQRKLCVCMTFECECRSGAIRFHRRTLSMSIFPPTGLRCAKREVQRFWRFENDDKHSKRNLSGFNEKSQHNTYTSSIPLGEIYWMNYMCLAEAIIFRQSLLFVHHLSITTSITIYWSVVQQLAQFLRKSKTDSSQQLWRGKRWDWIELEWGGFCVFVMPSINLVQCFLHVPISRWHNSYDTHVTNIRLTFTDWLAPAT